MTNTYVPAKGSLTITINGNEILFVKSHGLFLMCASNSYNVSDEIFCINNSQLTYNFVDNYVVITNPNSGAMLIHYVNVDPFNGVLITDTD